jgi:hypothetical protein
VDEVRERLHAVHQNHRNALAVSALELIVAGDVDLLQLEGRFRPHLVENAPRALAQVAALRRVESDSMDRARA